jgi:hypothetical protein
MKIWAEKWYIGYLIFIEYNHNIKYIKADWDHLVRVRWYFLEKEITQYIMNKLDTNVCKKKVRC